MKNYLQKVSASVCGRLQKIDLPFPLILAATLLFFYPELVLGLQAPLVGDHWEQHYPWAVTLASHLKMGMLPFWTPLIQCGFPLAAESQTGIFYVPNLILFGLFPANWAYAFQLPLHFFICGWGIHVYLRMMGFSRQASALGAFAFVFGTGYGGAYYNVTSLKTLCWLPVLLSCAESYLREGRRAALLLMTAAAFQSLVAGYFHVAVLGGFFFLLYLFLRVLFFREGLAFLQKNPVRTLLCLTVSGAVVIVFALPQLLLTYQLAVISNRSGAAEGYAYAGSFSPLEFSTLLFPHFQGLFRGHCLYQGVGVVFLLVCLFLFKPKQKDPFVRLWFVLLVLAVLLALGRWSPLYVLLIKATGFHAFRTPAKFLIFINFAAAMLAAAGYSRIQQLPAEVWAMSQKRILKISGLVFGAAAVFLLMCWSGTVFFSGALESAAMFFVERFVHNQPGHPHSLDFYREKLAAYILYGREIFTPWQGWTAWVFMMMASVLVLVRKAGNPKRLLGILFILLTIDLYAFSFADLRTDFSRYAEVLKPSPVARLLLEEKNAGRLGRIYGCRKSDQSLPLVPSVNMLYGIEDIGAYSPLVFSRYYQSLGRFGNVNDSNVAADPDPAFVTTRLPLLTSLGVTHIVSAFELQDGLVDLLFKNTGVWVYRIRGTAKQFFLTSSAEYLGDWTALKERLMSPGFDPSQGVLLEDPSAPLIDVPGHDAGDILEIQDSGNRNQTWIVTNTQPCYFVWMQTWYPGWRWKVNGVDAVPFRAYGLFQAVFIAQAGEHRIEAHFDPVLSARGAS